MQILLKFILQLFQEYLLTNSGYSIRLLQNIPFFKLGINGVGEYRAIERPRYAIALRGGERRIGLIPRLKSCGALHFNKICFLMYNAYKI